MDTGTFLSIKKCEDFETAKSLPSLLVSGSRSWRKRRSNVSSVANCSHGRNLWITTWELTKILLFGTYVFFCVESMGLCIGTYYLRLSCERCCVGTVLCMYLKWFTVGAQSIARLCQNLVNYRRNTSVHRRRRKLRFFFIRKCLGGRMI
jgi:hypothetical protein